MSFSQTSWMCGDDIENTLGQLLVSSGTSTGQSVAVDSLPKPKPSACNVGIESTASSNDVGIKCTKGSFRPVERVGVIDRPVSNSKYERDRSALIDVITNPGEYKMIKPKYSKTYSYSGKLETRTFYSNSPTPYLQNRYEYVSLIDILKYITCGGMLCDSYREGFTEYVVTELNKTHKVEMCREKVSRIDGGIYEKESPMIAWCDYGVTAKVCLEWVLCNPEKLARLD